MSFPMSGPPPGASLRQTRRSRSRSTLGDASRADIAGGSTWSNRIPINAYPAAASDPNFPLLDDKNTFAVDNAGPDRDGTTGRMVACWTLDEPATAAEGPQQRIVCERSSDGGRTWPGSPQAI